MCKAEQQLNEELYEYDRVFGWEWNAPKAVTLRLSAVVVFIPLSFPKTGGVTVSSGALPASALGEIPFRAKARKARY